MAGAVGFEPTPSALTVRCPAGWTTPQRANRYTTPVAGFAEAEEFRNCIAATAKGGRLPALPRRVKAERAPKIARHATSPNRSQGNLNQTFGESVRNKKFVDAARFETSVVNNFFTVRTDRNIFKKSLFKRLQFKLFC